MTPFPLRRVAIGLFAVGVVSRKLVLMAGMAVMATACGQQPAGTSTGGPGPSAAASPGPGPEASTVTITFPIGDTAAGRQAFLDLKCTACHRVPSEPEFPAPVSASQGPSIDAQVAGRGKSYLAMAIMSPSHSISLGISDELKKRLEGTESPMGDFSRVMTIRQFVDVHTFIRSLK